MDYVMIIGAGLFQWYAIKEAKDMGYKTIAVDMDPNAIGFQDADEKWVISTRDVDDIVAKVKEFQKDGRKVAAVLTIGTDVTDTVAYIRNALGMPSISNEDALVCINKYKQRERFKEHGVSIPDFQMVQTLEEAESAAKRIGFPCVLKPTDNMGARGVSKLNSIEDLDRAWEFVHTGARKDAIFLVEEYMEGPELSIESFLYKGDHVFTVVGDRHITFEPYFVEIGHTCPSILPFEQIDSCFVEMRKAAKALNITSGPLKGDIKVVNGRAKIVEIAGRISGGYMSSHTEPLSTGINIIRATIQEALGLKPDLEQTISHGSAERAFLPKFGVLKEIKNLEEARKLPGVADIFIHKKPGDRIDKLTTNLNKAGNIITYAETRKEAIEIVEKAMDLIEFVVE